LRRPQKGSRAAARFLLDGARWGRKEESLDIFTMVVTACIAGQTNCTPARYSDPSFTSEEACYAHMSDITKSMTKKFAENPELKGKQVTYDVSCMNQEQLRLKLGTIQLDL
jgi:hypothetical protein